MALYNRTEIVLYCVQIDNNSSVLELLEDPDESHSDDDIEDSASVNLGPVRQLGSYLHHLGECTIDTESADKVRDWHAIHRHRHKLH